MDPSWLWVDRDTVGPNLTEVFFLVDVQRHSGVVDFFANGVGSFDISACQGVVWSIGLGLCLFAVHGGGVLVLLGIVALFLLLLFVEDVVSHWIMVQLLLHVVLGVSQHIFVVLTFANSHP